MNLHLALEAVSDGVVALDAEWRFTYVNRRGELLLRQQRQALIGRSWWEVFPYLLDTPAERELRAAAAATVQRRLRVFHPLLYAWHEVDAVPDGGGLVLVLRDVTDPARMRQVEAVRAAVREVLDPAPIAISVLRGPEHRIDYMNPMARQLLGGRDLEGLTVRTALPEVEGQGFFELLDHVFRTGEPYEGDEVALQYDKHGDGKLREGFFNITYQPFFEADGSVAGVLSVSVETAASARPRRPAPDESEA